MNGVNLHGIVRGAIATLNPDEDAILYTASGQGNVAGKIEATYLPPVAVKVQIQSETDEALYHSNNAGQNDITNRFYLFSSSVEGRPAGIIRPLGRSGDLFQRADGTWWLITAVVDDFSAVGWTSVRATLQTVPPNPKVLWP